MKPQMGNFKRTFDERYENELVNQIRIFETSLRPGREVKIKT